MYAPIATTQSKSQLPISKNTSILLGSKLKSGDCQNQYTQYGIVNRITWFPSSLLTLKPYLSFMLLLAPPKIPTNLSRDSRNSCTCPLAFGSSPQFYKEKQKKNFRLTLSRVPYWKYISKSWTQCYWNELKHDWSAMFPDFAAMYHRFKSILRYVTWLV